MLVLTKRIFGSGASEIDGSDLFSEVSKPPSLRFFPPEFHPSPPPAETGAGAGALEEEPLGVVRF